MVRRVRTGSLRRGGVWSKQGSQNHRKNTEIGLYQSPVSLPQPAWMCTVVLSCVLIFLCPMWMCICMLAVWVLVCCCVCKCVCVVSYPHMYMLICFSTALLIMSLAVWVIQQLIVALLTEGSVGWDYMAAEPPPPPPRNHHGLPFCV